MPINENLGHGHSQLPADSSSARGHISSAAIESRGDAAQSEDLADQTVISTLPPLGLRPAGAGFNPRELGQMLEGQQLDHVVLEQFVGGGGMGAVFRAWDTQLYRTVAVKVLSTYQASDAESHRRFQTEARSAARLDHPNIARVHYVGEDRGIRYIVFEYIEGTNVRDLVHARGALPLAEAFNYTLQIASALTHAWEREVVHRDIKPSNIIITPDGLAKLVDMGLARFEQLDGAENEETATGVTLGTFDYISPEQARNPRDADTRSDIYSLGCTLFYMLAGQPPFADGSVLQKLLLHQSEPPPDVRVFRPDVPDILASIVAQMLAKRPEERFQNPLELTAALLSCADQVGVVMPQPALSSYLRALPAWQRSWKRHAPWIVPVALLLASVLVLALKWNSEVIPPEFTELQVPAATIPAESEPAGAGVSSMP